ncbi:EF hand domain-containing protein [Toxoplasma gondii TgCatPRC2]|uniref:EF hand domain-containing protein n=13 Tax=Toxoplasma gondii TaxID=5811 RepID=A0A0F7UNG8_TOXGV|nr:EF hand domain-containing protein [Toxoplasma gondii ME49]EPR57609.1 EF hand domain-containing protein [Toxoplasma gondii GT1]ESS29270.1 EF hand domain-containing protein [Toxoplasma gondii VEG]KAF4646118.1 EF hand domain-containing protein [Toxoplasma gondii]KFG31931.1 EF hand domain-containing protein [Toxoplasma gondii GAB2-2007-GAL-DOM2]KFG35691.1 EF hand domain-containing protein [Toxoplasma gondii p89]KFG47087.1 EF hand domain-containing protein [Toxoplasma gondii FOU]KFG59477.1 EF |eukprot:XP_002370177.1 EF hand domain-containing protein [Toxoplasma gondii ME49]
MKATPSLSRFLFPGFLLFSSSFFVSPFTHVAFSSTLVNTPVLGRESLHLSAPSEGLETHSAQPQFLDKGGSGESFDFGGPCFPRFTVSNEGISPQEEPSREQSQSAAATHRGRCNTSSAQQWGDNRSCAFGKHLTPRACDIAFASVLVGSEHPDRDQRQEGTPILFFFDKLDRNRDGVLDLREAVRMLNALLKEISPPDNGFPGISRRDWFSVASAYDRGFVSEIVGLFDEDGDGVLHLGEFSALLLSVHAKSIGQTALLALSMKHRSGMDDLSSAGFSSLFGNVSSTAHGQRSNIPFSKMGTPGQLTRDELKFTLRSVLQQQYADAEHEVAVFIERLEREERRNGPSAATDEARQRRIHELFTMRALVEKGLEGRITRSDKNGDGRYDLFEVIGALEAESEHIGTCWMFASFDRDGDGRLSMAEARTIAEEATVWTVSDGRGIAVDTGRGLPTVGEKSRYYIQDRDTQMDVQREEVCTLCWILDANKDQFVTFDEFSFLVHNEDLVALGLRAMLKRDRDIVQF